MVVDDDRAVGTSGRSRRPGDRPRRGGRGPCSPWHRRWVSRDDEGHDHGDDHAGHQRSGDDGRASASPDRRRGVAGPRRPSSAGAQSTTRQANAASTQAARPPPPRTRHRRARPASSRRRAGAPDRASGGHGTRGPRPAARRSTAPPTTSRRRTNRGRYRGRPEQAPRPRGAARRDRRRPPRPTGACGSPPYSMRATRSPWRQHAVAGGEGVAVPGPGHQGEGDTGRHLDQGVADRDGLVAGVATAPQHHPGQQGHVLPPGQWRSQVGQKERGVETDRPNGAR